MQSRLFVYGSLVAAAAHPKGARLRAEAVLIGPATIAGRLYRVSWFPALRPPLSAGDRVHGEVYELAEPSASLAWLDAYEGITAGGQSAGAPDDYTREQRPVMLVDGTPTSAWVYLYQADLPGSAHIPDGRWRG